MTAVFDVPVPGVRPIIGANWKMQLTPSETDRYLAIYRDLVADVDDRDLYVLPAFPALAAARQRLAGSNIAWGAQDVHAEDSGAHTGDVSAPMLADLGCRYVMVGHTERRRDHGETYDLVGAKAAAVVRWGMVPIICLGEPRPVGPDAALAIVLQDLDQVIDRLPLPDPVTGRVPAEIVVAYEPSWAIGQGRAPAAPDDIGAVHRGIHDRLRQRAFAREQARVIYGGSVDVSVAERLLQQPDVDGLFIGRASVDPQHLAAIARTPLPASDRVTARARP